MRNLYLVLIIGVILISGCTSDNQADEVAQEPTCDPGVVGAWWLLGNEVYIVVESDCSISKFCDLINDYHSTGKISGNTLTIHGITTNEIVLEGNNTLILLGGPDGMDLPFTRIYREYGIDPIPEEC